MKINNLKQFRESIPQNIAELDGEQDRPTRQFQKWKEDDPDENILNRRLLKP